MGNLSAVFMLTIFQMVCVPKDGCEQSKLELMIPSDKEEACIVEGLESVKQFIRKNYGKSNHTYTFTCKRIPIPGVQDKPIEEKKDDTI